MHVNALVEVTQDVESVTYLPKFASVLQSLLYEIDTNACCRTSVVTGVTAVEQFRLNKLHSD